MIKTCKNIEFGDFQTPLDLAEKIAIIATNYLDKINTIVEPTCGVGSFIQAFTKIKTTAKDVIGWEINPQYVEIARKKSYTRISHKYRDRYKQKPYQV